MKLVLGLGGTVDYEIAWDSGVIEGLVEKYAIMSADLTSCRDEASIPVRSERDLVVVLLAHLRDGVGGERFIASSDIVEQFAARFEKRITLGGTCVRAAIAMRIFDLTCTLHLVSIDDHVRRLLPAGCDYICSAQQDSTDPHLIVQFGAGATVRAGDVDITSPHPNRMIFANDPPHRELVLSEDLGSVLREAEVFLISGFNVIQDAEVLDARLISLRQHMQQLPPDSLVLYEDSGFHVPALSHRVRTELIDLIDVYSLNEDELQAYLGRPLDLLEAAVMEKALGELQALIPAPTLVVHTKYWSLALGEQAGRYEAALQGGITMASTRYRDGDGFTADDYCEVASLPVNPRGAEFATELESRVGGAVRCLPASLLDVDRPTTIGLGDTFVGGFIAGLVRAGPVGGSA